LTIKKKIYIINSKNFLPLKKDSVANQAVDKTDNFGVKPPSIDNHADIGLRNIEVAGNFPLPVAFFAGGARVKMLCGILFDKPACRSVLFISSAMSI